MIQDHRGIFNHAPIHGMKRRFSYFCHLYSEKYDPQRFVVSKFKLVTKIGLKGYASTRLTISRKHSIRDRGLEMRVRRILNCPLYIVFMRGFRCIPFGAEDVVVDGDAKVVAVVKDNSAVVVNLIPPIDISYVFLSISTWQSCTFDARLFRCGHLVFVLHWYVFSRGNPGFWKLPCFSCLDSPS